MSDAGLRLHTLLGCDPNGLAVAEAFCTLAQHAGWTDRIRVATVAGGVIVWAPKDGHCQGRLAP
ncbi:MAG: hypothetical protein ACXVJW_19035 [Acidimicrobiia bacterium]